MQFHFLVWKQITACTKKENLQMIWMTLTKRRYKISGCLIQNKIGFLDKKKKTKNKIEYVSKDSSVGLWGLHKWDYTCHRGPARQSGTCHAAHLFVVMLDQSLSSLE